MLGDIEIAFRTHISYLIAHKYGALGYMNNECFINRAVYANLKLGQKLFVINFIHCLNHNSNINDYMQIKSVYHSAIKLDVSKMRKVL